MFDSLLKKIAETVHEDLKRDGFPLTILQSCNDYAQVSNKLDDFPNARLVVFIISTTGQVCKFS